MDLLQGISEIGFSVAAFCFTAISLWQARAPEGGMHRRSLAIASAMTAIWSAALAISDNQKLIPVLSESFRNLTWLGFMLLLLHRGGAQGRKPTIVALYGVLAGVLAGQIGVDIAAFHQADSSRLNMAFFDARMLLHMMFDVGALVLVHNLYTAAAPEARWGIKLPMIVLAAMWVYDLNLHTVSYLAKAPSVELLQMRGPLAALLAPVLALGSRRNAQWKMRLSRTVTFRSLSLMAAGGYLLGMVLLARTMELAGTDYIALAQVTLLCGMTISGVILIPSPRLRAWLKVTLLKHLFQHRYDYRAEWMRFTDTLGHADDQAAPLHVRVIKAIADITDSPGGLLLLPDDSGGLASGARWGWRSLDPPGTAADATFAGHIERTGRIIEFDALRWGYKSLPAEKALVPAWILAETRAWVAVPLMHFERLVGMVLLERPPINRLLDWEDFDLLRLAGRQVASYLAEAQSQEALSEAKRFDEFNRRFAFILHDIKNLVSQLSLVARNAERHADNPEFRADMIATLRASVGKLNDLLARLSHYGKTRSEEPRPLSLWSVAEAVAGQKRMTHPVKVEGCSDVLALADPSRLEQAITHLVQNAVEASGMNRIVRLVIERSAREASIAVIDQGIGMSAEFIRNQLFKPFSSTKEGGFGIGAFEARTLVTAMGGRLEVESREGQGSSFTVHLPLADTSSLAPARKLAS
jgi:putative PEP-CTERM system histidine kinase